MQRFVFLVIALGTGLIALATIGIYFYERPTTLRIAVARGAESQKLFVALNQQLVHEQADVRFRLVLAEDAQASAKLIEDDLADLAVVRSDIPMPTNAATALVLDHLYLLIAAPAGAHYSNVSELKGKRIAIVSSEAYSEANQRLFDLIKAQYFMPSDALTEKPVELSGLTKLLQDGEVDAVLAFGRFDSQQLSETVQILSHSVSPPEPPVFIPILESNAIAKKFPGLEATEILRGAFGGSPSQPTENVETIGATLRLVARTDLANSLISDVTRLILAARAPAAAVAPVANYIEAPNTNKAGVLPTHPGAAAFLDGEEETFFEKYSDIIYIGAMVGSLLISGVATLASRLAVRGYERFDVLMERVLTILKLAREAPDAEALARLEHEIDDILTQSLVAGLMPKLDGHQLTALSLAVQQARLAIAGRRSEIGLEASRSAQEPSAKT
jgi:TRAP-type uncharacterized transport system substrate-binding protein